MRFTLALLFSFGIVFSFQYFCAGRKPKIPDPSLYYSPYYKGPVCTPSMKIQHPATARDIQKLVLKAIRKNTTLKAFGVRHSATDILCTNGIPVDMSGFRGIVYNATDHSVTVGAGVNVYDLCDFLKTEKRALNTIPGFGNITVGGAIGTGAHGSTLKYTPSISDQVISLNIIDGQGNFRRISDSEELNGFRVHLGLLGVILDVTLATQPLYKVRGHTYFLNDTLLFDGSFMDLVADKDQIALYWFPSTSKVVVVNYTMVDATANGKAWSNDPVPATYAAANAQLVPLAEYAQSFDPTMPDVVYAQIAQLQDSTMSHLVDKEPLFPPIYTEDGTNLSNPAVGYYYKMYAAICHDSGDLQCPFFHGPFNITQMDNEFAFDIEKLPAVVRTVKDIVTKYKAAFPAQGILLRFSKPSNSYMSTAFGQTTCHFEFYMLNRENAVENATAGLGAYQTITQSLFFKYGGKSHWGKSGAVYHSTENLSRNLDSIAKRSFLKLMNKYDPNGVFMNDFGQRLKGTGTKMNTDPDVTHCALLENCICTFDDDCAGYQSCAQVSGYRYPACINKVLLESLE